VFSEKDDRFLLNSGPIFFVLMKMEHTECPEKMYPPVIELRVTGENIKMAKTNEELVNA